METFGMRQAKRLLKRIEWHHTPKHASWLNMAEIEIGLLVRACLDRRIDSPEAMRKEVDAYLLWMNANPIPIKWQFTNQDARTKLHSIYPII